MCQRKIFDLPNEILRYIFSFLNLSDWLSLNRVCLRFSDILPQDCFFNVKKIAVIDLDGFSEEDVQHYKSSMKLKLLGGDEVVLFTQKDTEGYYLNNGEELAHLLKMLPNVEEVLLLIRSYCIPWSPPFFNAIEKDWRIKKLVVPDLVRMEVEAILTKKTNLNSVKIKFCGVINYTDWLYKYCKYIEYNYILKTIHDRRYVNKNRRSSGTVVL